RSMSVRSQPESKQTVNFANIRSIERGHRAGETLRQPVYRKARRRADRARDRLAIAAAVRDHRRLGNAREQGAADLGVIDAEHARGDALAGLYFFQAEDGIRDADVTGVQTCALPISSRSTSRAGGRARTCSITTRRAPT